MPLSYPLVDVNDVPIVNTGLPGELRIPISGKDGSTTSAFHLTLQPGEEIRPHRNDNCEEISVYLSGHGENIIAGQCFKVREGHCMRVPMGVAHQFQNTSEEPVQMVGFYIGADTLAARGFETVDKVGVATLNGEHVIHWNDVKPENMDRNEGWPINDFRLPFGTHNGSTTTLFRAQFFPGAVHKKHAHKNCEEIYYLISGHAWLVRETTVSKSQQDNFIIFLQVLNIGSTTSVRLSQFT